jgi:hypothetical protein
VRLDGHHFGELHDYYGGNADLERGLVRVLHSLSFADDPTRMLRAVRYEQRYGFAIESRTLQLMDEARPLVARLSAERIRHELDLFFDEPRAAAMLPAWTRRPPASILVCPGAMRYTRGWRSVWRIRRRPSGDSSRSRGRFP